MTDVIAEASDPNTDLARLAELVASHPETRPLIAVNPSTYPDLLAWLASLNDPVVNAALAQRNGIPPTAAPAYFAPAPPQASNGLSIAALVFAFLAPFIGFILSLVAQSREKAQYGRASGLAKGATAVSVILFVLTTAGGIGGGFALADSIHDAKVKPFCDETYAYPEIFDDYDGLYSLSQDNMYGLDPEGDFYNNYDLLSQYASDVQNISYYAPDDDDLAYATQELSEALDTSQGWTGSNWSDINYALSDVSYWIDRNC